jgi:hypothetical protein
LRSGGSGAACVCEAVLESVLPTHRIGRPIIDDSNFQRIGSVSNAHVGRDFEAAAKQYFRQQGVVLSNDFQVPLGAAREKKIRRFDLGSKNPAVLVECKSHHWTSGGNIPSAKLTVWNEAMYYFHLAPAGYRKILFVLRDLSTRRGETLATYYIRTYGHLIPKDVEILELDEETGLVQSATNI